MPLWHEAWPKKDFKMMKDLLPQARAGVAKVAEARLPGILREKQAAWDQGVVGLKDALARYEAAAGLRVGAGRSSTRSRRCTRATRAWCA